jgi:hypothetical protein
LSTASHSENNSRKSGPYLRTGFPGHQTESRKDMAFIEVAWHLRVKKSAMVRKALHREMIRGEAQAFLSRSKKSGFLLFFLTNFNSELRQKSIVVC